jgi:outer membrane murein-binding lipoprotein Lpp
MLTEAQKKLAAKLLDKQLVAASKYPKVAEAILKDYKQMMETARRGFFRPLVLLAVLLLSGCIGDQKGSQDQVAQPPIINVPPSQTVDTDKLRAGIKDDITASSNNMANQLTGLVNVPIAKLAEKLTGLEATIQTEIKNTLSVNTQASADLRAKLEAMMTVLTEIKVSFKMITEFNTSLDIKMSADASLIRDLQAKVDTLNAQLSAQIAGMANGQVGLLNKIESKLEQVTNTAGHDINYLPKEAVQIMLDREKTFMYIFGAIMSAITIAIGWIGRNARERERLRADAEKQERKMVSDLLMEALAMMPESKAKDIRDLRAKIASRTRSMIMDDVPDTPNIEDSAS